MPSTLNVTVPVRVPAPGDTTLTVPVNVTDEPNNEGLADELTVVVVLAVVTVWMRSAEVLPVKLPSPPYSAVIVWLPVANVEVANVARPAASVPVPNVVAPSLKVTVPVADACETVAVKVTDWPNTDGLTEEATPVLVPALLTVCVKLTEVPVL